MAKKSLVSKRFDSFWVMVNLAGPQYWKVSRDGTIEKVNDVDPKDSPVISFDEDDYRGVFDHHISRNGARKHFLREYSEKSRLLYRGGKKPVYATPIHRLMQFNHYVYPGAWFMDKLIARDQLTHEEDKIIGFSFDREDDGDPFRIVVLYAWRADGSMSAPSVSLNPADIELIVSEFAKDNGVEASEVLLYPAEDIFDVGPGMAYPLEEDTLGIPMSRVYSAAATLFLVATVGVSGLDGWHMFSQKLAEKETLRIKKETAKVKSDQNRYVHDHLQGYIKSSTMVPSIALKYAGELYEPNTKLSRIEIANGIGAISVEVSFYQDRDIKQGFMPREIMEYMTLKQNIPGLTREQITLKGDTNAYEIKFTFKAANDSYFDLAGV